MSYDCAPCHADRARGGCGVARTTTSRFGGCAAYEELLVFDGGAEEGRTAEETKDFFTKVACFANFLAKIKLKIRFIITRIVIISFTMSG